jgi:hypothetical protein
VRFWAGFVLIVITAGCVTDGVPAETTFDEAAWELEHVGKPASFTGTGGGSSGRSGGSGSMQPKANLTLQPPTVICTVASARTVSCFFEVLWSAQGGGDLTPTGVEVSFPLSSDQRQTCEASAGDVCTLNGTMAFVQTVNATNPYPDFRGSALLESSSSISVAKVGSKSGELEWHEQFTVRFHDGHPIPDDSQAPITMHTSYGPISI